MSEPGNILAVNGGSSSIKFAVYSAAGELHRRFSGKVDRIGFPDVSLTFAATGKNAASEPIDAPDHVAGATILMDRIASRLGGDAVTAIGHRIVHGGPKYSE